MRTFPVWACEDTQESLPRVRQFWATKFTPRRAEVVIGGKPAVVLAGNGLHLFFSFSDVQAHCRAHADRHHRETIRFLGRAIPCETVPR